MKIQNKILLMVICLILPVFLILIVVISNGIEQNLMIDIEDKMLNYKNISEFIIKKKLPSLTDKVFLENASMLVDELSGMSGLRVSLYNQEGFLADSKRLFAQITPETRAALQGKTAYNREYGQLYFAFPVNEYGAARMIYPLGVIERVVSSAVRQTGVIIIISLFILIVMAVLLSRKISAPITRLKRETMKIKEGSYDLDLDIETNDEIGDLALSFNEMADEIKVRVKQLEESVAREKKLKNLQSDFLSSVTHEFKTPLTSIIGYADLLKEYEDPEFLDEAVNIIRKEGERLYQLVEKVLYLSRIEKYEIEPEFEWFEVEQLIEDSIDGISMKAAEKGINISKSLCFKGSIKGDYNLLYRMLINIFDNAVKYNHQNGIIRVVVDMITFKDNNDCSERYTGEKRLKILIKDSGTGIAKSDLERIYEPFYREDKIRSRKIGGDGLGLAIVKEIVEKHKGQIKIKSEKDKGTRVAILLPIFKG